MQEIELLALFKNLLFLVFFFSGIILGQHYPDKSVDSLITGGINNIIRQNYSAAEKTFTELNNSYPELPFGKIYLAALRIAESYDYAEEFDTDYIEENLNAAKQQSEELLDNNQDSIWYNYFYALTEGYISYFEALNEDWISALTNGMNSIKSFENCLTGNDNFYEAYIAIGTFEYWKSRKTEFLNWLPFYEDDRSIGIDKLKTAAKLASYNSYLAINSLIWIYIDEKDFTSAIELGETALKEFPDSRYFKWGLARAYEGINPMRSIELYEEILNSYPPGRTYNHINEIVLKHLIAQQSAKIGITVKALQLCNDILNIDKLDDYAKNKLENRLKRVRKLKDSLEK